MTRPSKANMFNVFWGILSLFSSAYFGLLLFPQEYKKVTGAEVELYFQTRLENRVIYRPNDTSHREKYIKDLSPNSRLYFDACDLLKYQIKITCDSTTNWKIIKLNTVDCEDVKNCEKDRFILSREEKYEALIELVNENNLEDNEVLVKQIKTGDPATKEDMDLKNPITWGDTEISKWAIFILLLIFMIKAGRVTGEFLFKPYADPA